ncbi:MAG: hypothetical protein LHV68_05120 [Elusimicrobia bacterium]|nr:hypothetical protein [Candidatus Liberimonas magnetica]
MQITLETVRDVLRKALGWESFVARFISRTVENRDLPTVCINKDGVLEYNPEFLDKYVNTQQDLFCVVFHELLHPMFNHFIYRSGKIDNFAADSIINAVISKLYSEQSDGGKFFTKLYPATGLTGLLRPKSSLSETRFENLYSNLYYRSPKLTTGEVIQTLRILADTVPSNVTLIGSHTGGDGIPADVAERIASELKEKLLEKFKNAGCYDNMVDLFIEILKSKFTLRKQMLEKYASNSVKARFKSFVGNDAERVSPVLLSGCRLRRAAVLLSCGIYPVRYYIPKSSLRPNKGIIVYLDVSGSVENALPDIVGILMTIKDKIGKIYAFSNAVKEIPFTDLVKGEVETTGGTDFDCIANSILEHRHEHVIVITDGFASLEDELLEKLKNFKPQILTILFDGKDNCLEFQPFGDVVQLDDIKEVVA